MYTQASLTTAIFITIGPFDFSVFTSCLALSLDLHPADNTFALGDSKGSSLRCLSPRDAIKKDHTHGKVRGAYRYEDGCKYISK